MSRFLLSDLVVLAVLALLATAPHAHAQPADPGHLGPSFACPTPRDPLGQLICASPLLARRDLEFVQAYQALQQQSAPAQQPALRAEAAEFARTLRTECGVGTANPPPPQAAACVEHGYGRQHDNWTARLTGSGLQEARRSLPDHLALQQDLRTLGLLPADEPVDGVYGPRTRTAVLAFQQTVGLPQTGLIGDEDAAVLARRAGPAPRSAPPPQDRTAWDTFRGEALPMGVTAAWQPGGADCAVTLEVRDPDALRTATAEALRAARQPTPDDADKLFAAEVEFLRTRLATRAVRALFATPGTPDLCRFDAAAFTTDIFGRDVPQPLFTFTLDRVTQDKVVWSRFDPANLPRIVSAFAYGSYARDRLNNADPTPGAPAAKPAITPASIPAPRPRRAAPPVEQASAAPSPELARWSGTATLITRPFHVDGAWELHRQSAGSFSATLHRLGSDRTVLLAMSGLRADSTAFQPDGGDFYLEFTGLDPWSATVNAIR